MNFVIGNDCYAAQNNSTGVWFSHSGNIPATGNINILNISYRNRLLCVLGVTIWSQIAFLGLTQICKPLRLLTMIILVYTVLAYIAWLVIFAKMVTGPASKVCTPALDTTSNLGVVKHPFFDN